MPVSSLLHLPLLDHPLKPGLVRRLHISLPRRDPFRLHERHQRVVHQLHPLRAPALDHRGQHGGVALADDVWQAGGLQEDLVDGAAALAVDGLQEELGDDSGDGLGQGGTDLRLLFGRKRIFWIASRISSR